MSPNDVPILLRFPRSRPFFEFRPQPADASRACARHQSQAGAEEIVLLRALETAAESLLVKLAEFLSRLHPFGAAFGQGGTLAPVNPSPVETRDGFPADVSLWVERPI